MIVCCQRLCFLTYHRLLQVCPNIPWGDFSANVVTNDMGWLTLDGYEALWALNTHIYPDTTLEYLAHLGYNSDARGNQLTAVRGYNLNF